MNWFWLTIIYLVFLITAQVINKKSVNNLDIDEIIFGASVQIATSLFSLVLILFTGWQFSFNFQSLPLLVGMGITYFIAVSLYFFGLKKIELSTVAILDSLGAVNSLFLGIIILGETLESTKVFGVAAIIIAVLVATFNKNIKFEKNAWIIIASTFFYALGAVFDKKLNSFGNPLSYLFLSFAIAGISMLIVYYKKTLKAFSGTFTKPAYWKGILSNGLLYSLGFWSLFEAYNRGGEVSKMFPMTLSMSVIVPLSGIIFLKERDNLSRKLISVVIMVMGLWILGR